MVKVVIAWPDKRLTPHAKGGWSKKYKATKAAKHEAWALALEAGVRPDPEALIFVTYHPPDRLLRDAQNMPGRLKAAIDGIALAMGVDDIGFRVRFADRFEEVKEGGCVIFDIRRESEAKCCPTCGQIVRDE